MGTAVENLDAAQRVFAEFEQHRQQETLIKLNALAENRSLARAVTDYRRSSGVSATMQRELDHLAAQLAVDALDPRVARREDHRERRAAPRRVAGASTGPPQQSARHLGSDRRGGRAAIGALSRLGRRPQRAERIRRRHLRRRGARRCVRGADVHVAARAGQRHRRRRGDRQHADVGRTERPPATGGHPASRRHAGAGRRTALRAPA